MGRSRHHSGAGAEATEERTVRAVGIALILSLLCVGAAWSEDAQQPPERLPELKLALDVTLTTAIAVEALKRTFKDPRPDGSEYGFPSGDAALAFALARVASEYHPKQRVLWYLIAARVAWSRVRREAHDWEDVIGGAALGSWIGDAAIRNGGIVLKTWEW